MVIFGNIIKVIVIVDRVPSGIGDSERCPRTPQMANVTNRSHLTGRTESLSMSLKGMVSAKTCPRSVGR